MRGVPQEKLVVFEGTYEQAEQVLECIQHFIEARGDIEQLLINVINSLNAMFDEGGKLPPSELCGIELFPTSPINLRLSVRGGDAKWVIYDTAQSNAETAWAIHAALQGVTLRSFKTWLRGEGRVPQVNGPFLGRRGRGAIAQRW